MKSLYTPVSGMSQSPKTQNYKVFRDFVSQTNNIQITKLECNLSISFTICTYVHQVTDIALHHWLCIPYIVNSPLGHLKPTVIFSTPNSCLTLSLYLTSATLDARILIFSPPHAT